MSSPTKLRQMAKELGWPPELEKAADQLQKLKRENVVLRADKKRLDWLMNKGDAWAYRHMSAANILTRAAIDAARKEGKIRKKLSKTLVEEAQP